MFTISLIVCELCFDGQFGLLILLFLQQSLCMQVVEILQGQVFHPFIGQPQVLLTHLLQLLLVVLLALKFVLLVGFIYLPLQVDSLQCPLTVEDALFVEEAHILPEDHFVLLLLCHVLAPCQFLNGRQTLLMPLLHLGKRQLLGLL